MIKVKRVKGIYGPHYTLTDDKNKETWVGEAVASYEDNPKKTIDNFIRDRKQQIERLKEQIEEAEKL
jgi:hypothetical protein